MNAPFQSVGIIFFVTIVHVVAIAVYSSRTLPETTFQRSIVMPDVESLEVMPEQLVRDLTATDLNQEPESCLDYLKMGVVLESDSRTKYETPGEKTEDVLKVKVPKSGHLEMNEGEKEVPVGKVVEAEVAPIVKAERWEDGDFAKRVSYPHLDGIIGEKSKKLAENKPSPAPKVEIKSTANEPAPRSRSFSPIPRS